MLEEPQREGTEIEREKDAVDRGSRGGVGEDGGRHFAVAVT